MISTRQTARQCGTVNRERPLPRVGGHRAGRWGMTSVHINVEVGGGVGSIDFRCGT
jgi:hypothetical protein